MSRDVNVETQAVESGRVYSKSGWGSSATGACPHWRSHRRPRGGAKGAPPAPQACHSPTACRCSSTLNRPWGRGQAALPSCSRVAATPLRQGTLRSTALPSRGPRLLRRCQRGASEGEGRPAGRTASGRGHSLVTMEGTRAQAPAPGRVSAPENQRGPSHKRSARRWRPSATSRAPGARCPGSSSPLTSGHKWVSGQEIGLRVRRVPLPLLVAGL